MPSLTRFLELFNASSLSDPPPKPTHLGDVATDPATTASSSRSLPPITSFALAPTYDLPEPPADAPLLIPTQRLYPSQIPPGALLFGLTHPHPLADERTAFFLDCLPDSLGWLAHCATFIAARIGPSRRGPDGELVQVRWRHPYVHLILEDKPGLAATCAGEVRVSLQWVGSLMAETRRGGRDRAGVTKELKGVLLHELVHAIQYDGRGSAPSWLTESIADYVRLQAHLDPPHWRVAGQGRGEKGWEDGYDAGARFLAWIEGNEAGPSRRVRDGSLRGAPTRTSGAVAPPQATQTQYPAQSPPSFSGGAHPNRYRPGPWPDLTAQLNVRLRDAVYDERWWAELTATERGEEGLGLAQLWKVYLAYYAA